MNKTESGQFINAWLCDSEVITREKMTELEKAKGDMDYAKHKGGFAYKQAKRHYEKLLRRAKRNGRQPRATESV